MFAQRDNQVLADITTRSQVLAAIQDPEELKKATIVKVTRNDFLEHVVFTEILSTSNHRPALLGYVAPTPRIAQLAREVLNHKRVLGLDQEYTQAQYKMPLSQRDPVFSPQLLELGIVQEFLAHYQKHQIVVYQSVVVDLTNIDGLALSEVSLATENDIYATFEVVNKPKVTPPATPAATTAEDGGAAPPQPLTCAEEIQQRFEALGIVPSTLMKTNLFTIYPAWPKLVEKFRDEASTLVIETPAVYAAHHVPTIPKWPLTWVYDILDGKKEQDTVLMNEETWLGGDEDNAMTDEAKNAAKENIGFMLAVDTKGMTQYKDVKKFLTENPDATPDASTLKSMWFLALPHRKDIASLRDLTAEHLPLLENMEKKITEYVQKHYGMTARDLVMYVHYHPTFYHLHIHVNHVLGSAETTMLGKCFSLRDIINNLKMVPDYYQRATLEMRLTKNHAIAKSLAKAVAE